MIKLYLDNKLCDIKEDIDIALTYEMNDLSNPEAVKSSYSKTVKLEGTTTNNTIFSHIYRLDKSILDSNTNLIGLNFNPNKRVPYYIELNGEIIDSGYFQLDNINCNTGAIEYEVTLYGGIGDFFYNLMYDDNEEDKTLGSLYYGIDGMTKEQEDKNLNLFEYDKDFVKECWKRRTEGNVNTNSKYEMFCPIPSHSGLYDDFSSDTVLTNETTGGIPEYIAGETKSYGRLNDFAKVTTPRELSEWEIGDLRSHYQRLGVKMSSIYNAIKDPVNNGGYEVDDSNVDLHSLNYIANGYVMLDRFDYETINQSNKAIPITLSKNPLSPYFNLKDVAYSQTIDVSEFVNPHMTVSIVPQVKVTNEVTGEKFKSFFSIGPQELKELETVSWNPPYGIWHGVTEYVRYGWRGAPTYGSWQVYYARLMDANGNTIKVTKPIVYGSYELLGEGNFFLYYQFELAKERLLKETGKYFPELGYSTNEEDYNLTYIYDLNKNDIAYQKNTNVGADIGKEFVAPENIQIVTDIPKNCKQVRIEAFTVGTGYIYNAYIYPAQEYLPFTSREVAFRDHLPEVYWKPIVTELYEWQYIVATGYLLDWNTKYSVAMIDNGNAATYSAYGYVNNTAENISQIYDGAVAVNSRRHVLNKQQIFAETDTPFDYLISMGKIFNWVFEKDVVSKKIRIYSKYKYYDGIIKDISNDIDRTSYSISPSSIEYNSYKYNIPLPDTYQTELFKKKNNRIYSQFNYKPNYQFNSESYEVLEDTKYTIGIPYQMHSIYFTPINNSNTPKVTMGNKFTVMLWQMYGGDETEEQDFKGKMLTSNSIVDSNDASAKICCFDKENASVGDCKNVFVLYNGNVWGYSDNNENILYLSNDAPIIDTLCDGNAYIITQGQPITTALTSPDKEVIQDRIWIYPSFGITDLNGYTLSFNEEGNKKNLWDLFHKNDVTNIYNKDSKVLKIKYRLKEQPYKALRHFYYIDNTLWILNNINDYKPNEEGFTEVEFIKLIDVNTYCKPNE